MSRVRCASRSTLINCWRALTVAVAGELGGAVVGGAAQPDTPELRAGARSKHLVH